MTYTKSFSETVSFPGFRKINNTTVDYSSTKVLLGSRTGVRMPDWREKLRNGSDATTPFQSDRYRFEVAQQGAASLVASIAGNPGAGTQSQTFKGWVFPPSESLSHLLPDQATAEADALRQAYNKVNSEVNHLAGASSMAEFGDVLHQFGHPFQSIIDLTNRRLNMLELQARGLRGSVVFRKIKFAEIVASTWLEYAFGLAPLISDTKKAAEALARFHLEVDEDLHRRSKVIARGQSSKATFTQQVGSVNSTWLIGTNNTKTVTEQRVQYVCGLGASVTAAFGSNERLLELLGFRPQDLLPAAWEVVPWSWLVDYFTNVGDILKAGATSTGQITWISKAVTQVTTRESVMPIDWERTKTAAFNAGWTKLNATTGTHLGTSRTIRTTVNRTVGEKLGVPPLVFSLPTGYGQLANMAAVLISKRPSSSALWLT